nr:unnamed protein product [Callosobruchus analis]
MILQYRSLRTLGCLRHLFYQLLSHLNVQEVDPVMTEKPKENLSRNVTALFFLFLTMKIL